MSLKVFHIFFIILSTALCAGVSWWCMENDVAGFWRYLFAFGTVVLPIYGAWFLWRTRKLIL